MDAPLPAILANTLERYVGLTLTPDLAARLGASVLRQVYPGPVDISGIAPLRVGNYVLAPVRAHDVLEDLKALHRAHWQETETHRQDGELNPDYARGLELEQQGRYVLIAVVHMDTQQMVGNMGLYLSRSMHTQDLVATEDTLYILPEHRRGRLGISMIRYVEQTLVKLGVKEIVVSVKPVNEVGAMIERMDYMLDSKQYRKALKETADV